MEQQAGTYFCVLLDMGATWTDTVAGLYPDVFSSTWARRVEAIAAREVASRRQNPWLLGYFPDNELNWGGHYPPNCAWSKSCVSSSLLSWFLLRLENPAAG